MRECKKCGVEKADSEFQTPRGINCIECLKKKKHEIYLRHKEKNKLKRQKFREENLELVRERQREYYHKNKEIFAKAVSKYKKKKRQTDELWLLKEQIRSHVGRAFREAGITKDSKTFEILGCTAEEFKQYIESKFEPWMSWDNRSRGNSQIVTEEKQYWDLDHIIPLTEAKTKEDVLRLSHYTNFQPLCSYYNRFIKKDIV